MYGWKTNTNLINIFNNISKIYPNTYCLLHPSENKINNPWAPWAPSFFREPRSPALLPEKFGGAHGPQFKYFLINQP